MQKIKRTWQNINLQIEANTDPLLASLVLLTRYFNNPYSAKALIARLPVKNQKLSKRLFARAANKAKLNTKFLDKSIDEITDSELPAILLLKNDQACILTVDENGKRFYMDPTNEGKKLRKDTVINNYLNQAIAVKPQYQSSDRAQDITYKERNNWFWKTILKTWPIYTEVLIASLLVNLFALVIPLFIMNVYNRVIPNYAIETMWVLASGVTLVFIFDFLLKSLRSYFIDLASRRSDQELSANIFYQILGLKMAVRPKSVGALANTVQSFEIFRDFITSSTMTILVDLPFVFIYILVIYLIGGSLFWIPFLVVPIIFLIGFVLQLPIRRLTQKSYQFSAEKQATLIETLSNIEAVKTSTAESKMQNRWEEVIDEASKNGIRLRMISNSSMNITTLIQQLATILVVIVGVYLINIGELSVGALIASTILTGRAMAPMAQVAALFTRYYQSVNALRSLDMIMQEETDVNQNEKYLHREKITGEVEFKNVSFNYQDEQISALHNINFKIKKGEKVAFIGRIGSGKSTIARLIMQLYEPTEGSIFIDGTDYRQLNPDDLRQQIGYVSQDVSLFYGSIHDNINIGASFVSDTELLHAAEISGVTEFTSKHPQGFDRQVGEKGNQLSGGQRQAIAMARAILLKPKLLILDEPTSNMDDSNERRLKKELKSHFSDKSTLILITHKMSMLELVDRIIVIEGGKVIADGSKESVLHALKAGMSAKGKSK